MSRKYAEDTTVPVERSRAEIEKICTNYGAERFATGWDKNQAMVMFRMKDRYVRIELPLPILGDLNASSWERKDGLFYSTDKLAQETRRRWRCLVLYIKAKLDSVESQIVSFEEAFLSHIVLPNGQTVGQSTLPHIAETYRTGQDIPLLGGRTC